MFIISQPAIWQNPSVIVQSCISSAPIHGNCSTLLLTS